MRGRTPHSTRSEREGTAAILGPIGAGSKFAGKGRWKWHPVGDELVQLSMAGERLLLGRRLQHRGHFERPFCFLKVFMPASIIFSAARGPASANGLNLRPRYSL
jgi:hypothetical protein